jgi:hypothetical protein
MSTDILHFPARVLVIRAARAVTGSDSDPGTRFCRSTRATCGPPASRLRRRTYWPVRVRSRGRNGSQHSTVTRTRRLTRMSHTTPIGWPQRESGAPQPRVTAGRPLPLPRCRSTSHQASVRETPNGEARGCVGQRRTRLGRRTVVTLSSGCRKSH